MTELAIDNELRKIVFKEETAFKIANYFKEKNTPIKIDYRAKFGITEQDFCGESNIVDKDISEEIQIDSSESKVTEKLDEKEIDEAFSLSDTNKQLTEKLKFYRNEKAKEEGYSGLKYHYVFSSDTINNLVEKKPQTNEQLFNIKGLGEVKINKYGNDILRIIKEHTSIEKSLKSTKFSPFSEIKSKKNKEKSSSDKVKSSILSTSSLNWNVRVDQDSTAYTSITSARTASVVKPTFGGSCSSGTPYIPFGTTIYYESTVTIQGDNYAFFDVEDTGDLKFKRTAYWRDIYFGTSTSANNTAALNYGIKKLQ